MTTVCLSHATQIGVWGEIPYGWQSWRYEPAQYHVEINEPGEKYRKTIASGTYEEAHRFYEEVLRFMRGDA